MYKMRAGRRVVSRWGVFLLLALFLVNLFSVLVPESAFAESKATFLNPQGEYAFNVPTDTSPAIPNIDFTGQASKENGLIEGFISPFNDADSHFVSFGGFRVKLDSTFTKTVSAGNNHTLGFAMTHGSRYYDGSTNQPESSANEFTLTVSIDVCDPMSQLNGHGSSTSKDLANWFGGTLSWLLSPSNVIEGITDNTELMQYIRDASASNNGTKSTNGKCSGATVDTSTDALTRQISITVDLPEDDWKAIVDQKLENTYPQWFEYNLVSVATGDVVGTQIVDIKNVIGNSDGKFTVIFKSDKLVKGEYRTAVFIDQFSRITKSDALYVGSDDYEGSITIFDGTKFDNFFEYLKGRFPAGKDAATVPTTGNVGVAEGSAVGTEDGLVSSDGDDNVKCELSGNTLSWLLCPIINGSLDGASAIFKNFVEPMLQTSPIVTDVGSDDAIMSIWRSFRTLGNIVLIFALLFVVFGQSIGGGIVDAYTAKKTIPRILIAAILINLSIYICAIMVDIFNVLGQGLARLIVTPLKDGGNLRIHLDAGDGKTQALGITAILGAVLLAVAGSTIWNALKTGSGNDPNAVGGANGSVIKDVFPYIFVFIVVPIFLAILGIFITLIIRRAIILLLTIISPIALALFAVPSADKYAKKWLDAFIKTLMVYPIITGIFGISQVLAVVTFNSGDSGSITILLATLIIAFAPLFMIPFAFKLAGGIVGGLSNAVRGSRDSLKKVWGDDKHNPNSLRHKMSHNAAHRASNRLTFGAAGMDNKMTGFIGRRMGKREEYMQAKAARDAAGNFTGTDPGMAVARSAASRSASKLKKEGLDDLSVAKGSEFAGNAAKEYNSEAIGELAGDTAQSLMQNPEFRNTDGSINYDAVQAGTEAVAAANKGGIVDKGELDAVAHAAATLRHKGGAALTVPQRQSVISAAVRTKRHAVSKTWSPAQSRAGIASAARVASDLTDSSGGKIPPPQAVIDRASEASGRSVGEAYGEGRNRGLADNDIKLTNAMNAAEVASKTAALNQTDPSFDNTAVHDAGGRAAAAVIFDNRTGSPDLPARAGAKAAAERATARPGRSDAAADIDAAAAGALES